jgi:ABC-type multidrug transport system fused ATPase/permease subunit
VLVRRGAQDGLRPATLTAPPFIFRRTLIRIAPRCAMPAACFTFPRHRGALVSAQNGAAIEIAGLTKSFGRAKALDGLDLMVESGQVHGFFGPNGSGKTTTSGLDPLMEAQFQQCIHQVKDEGRTVLLSSHILAEVEALCDRVSIIRLGRTVESGTLGELRHLTRTSIAVETTRPLSGMDALPGVRDLVVDDHHAGSMWTPPSWTRSSARWRRWACAA